MKILGHAGFWLLATGYWQNQAAFIFTLPTIEAFLANGQLPVAFILTQSLIGAILASSQ